VSVRLALTKWRIEGVEIHTLGSHTADRTAITIVGCLLRDPSLDYEAWDP
jgi:hypothetical protein